jgi:hypothetical protein
LFSIRIKLLHAAYKYDAISRGCTPVERQECGAFKFLISGQTIENFECSEAFKKQAEIKHISKLYT